MAYQSVDKLQSHLADDIFIRTKDAKKASGRALGTIVEIISYYLLKTWGLQENLAIETKLAEYGEKEITHNVEFTLHKLAEKSIIEIPADKNISISYLVKRFNLKNIPDFVKGKQKNIQNFVNKEFRTIKNSTILGEDGNYLYDSYIDSSSGKCFCATIYRKPFAMIECKRVGKEGDAKGPQTIEKAKQGAYVARVVSCLQRIYDEQNNLKCFLMYNNKPIIDDYYNVLKRLTSGDLCNRIDSFILTIGIVSNHGNWFTSGNMNKELKVLKNSYDWLIFLKDEGLTRFVEDILHNPECKKAFLYSYSKSKETGKKNENIFTKSIMSYEADEFLTLYFKKNYKNIIEWFEVLSPERKKLEFLKLQLINLRK